MNVDNQSAQHQHGKSQEETSGQQQPTQVQNKEQAELERLKKQVEEYLNGWKRAKADYLNLRKQSEREKEELMKFANAALLMELFPIYDSLKRGLQHVPETEKDKEWVKGFSHIFDQFRKLFEQLGIKEIETIGQQFNHEQHHAVGKEKRSGFAPGSVIEEVKTGFLMHGRVIEPAQVRVAE